MLVRSSQSVSSSLISQMIKLLIEEGFHCFCLRFSLSLALALGFKAWPNWDFEFLVSWDSSIMVLSLSEELASWSVAKKPSKVGFSLKSSRVYRGLFTYIFKNLQVFHPNNLVLFLNQDFIDYISIIPNKYAFQCLGPKFLWL